MNRTILTVAGVFSASSLLLVDSAVKGTALLVLAAIAAMILRRDSAATRHLVWLLAIVALLVVPVLSAMLPQWRVLPEWAGISPQPVFVEMSRPSIARPTDGAVELPQNAEPVEIERPSATAYQPAAELPDSRPALVAPETIPKSAVWSWNWLNALPLVWAIGFCVLILRLMAARLMLWNTERHGTVIWSSRHPAKATHDAIGTALEAACLQFGIRRPVTLLIHPDKTMPVVWGILRCRLLLPVAARQWTGEQLRSVLLHELVHIKRRDTLAQLLAQIACALYWFNPLVWFAAWRLGVERERACDDLVLASGVRPSAYAGHLLEVVTGLLPARWTQSCGLAMARTSSLEGRLVAVLSAKLNRRGVSVALAAIALAIAGGVAVPIAMLRAAHEKPGAVAAQTQPAAESQPRESTVPGTFSEFEEKIEPNQQRAKDFLRLINFRRNADGTYPASSLANLRYRINVQLQNDPTWKDAAAARTWLERTAKSQDWKKSDLVPLLDEAAAWSEVLNWAIGKEIFDEMATVVKPGTAALAEQLGPLAFGPPAKNGLRVAWVLEPAKESYAIGEIVKCRSVFHNAGGAPVQFVTNKWHEYDRWTVRVRDANGKEIETRDKEIVGSGPCPFYGRFKLGPGMIAEVTGPSAAIGEGDYEEESHTTHIGRVIHAKVGDQVRISWEVPLPGFEMGDAQGNKLVPGPGDWTGTLKTGEVRFRVTAAVPKKDEPKPGAQLKPATEQKLKWGEPANGLRMALAWPPSLGEPGMGDAEEFYLVVQNVTQAAIRLTANDAAPNPRRLMMRKNGSPLSAIGDPRPMPGDWLLQPRDVAFVRLFQPGEKTKDGRTTDAIIEEDIRVFPQYSLTAEMSIEKAPAGAWTGKLATGETRCSVDVIPPKHKDAQALYKSWTTAARRDGTIPGGVIALLGQSVTTFIKNNPTWETTPQLEKMLPRFDASRDWTGPDAVALLDELTAVQATPISMALDHEYERTIGTGTPLPPELASAPWGKALPNGLRVAWLLEPHTAEHSLGTPLNSRILFHNAGKDAVVFRARTLYQSASHKARDAKGAEINISSTEWMTLWRLLPFRLAPGEFVEVTAAGIGVGANNKIENWRGIRLGSWIDAQVGDEVTFTPDSVPLSDSNEQPELLDGEPRWWLDHIKARLSRHLPFPADAEARLRLLHAVAIEVLGTSVSKEMNDAFVADTTPTALDSLAKRLARRAGLTAYTGSLQSAPTIFRVLPADPDAAKRPRVASNPGWYTLGDNIRLSVSRRPVGERTVNEATILFFSPDPKADAPGKPVPLNLPDGYNTWAAAWMRGGTVLWVQQKSGIRSYDFTNPAQVKETTLEEPANLEKVPQPILDALRAALDVPGAPKPAPETPKPAPAATKKEPQR